MNSVMRLGPVTEFIDKIDKIGPGSWPDWVAAIGTSLAFLIAARSYRKSVKDAHEAQARLVYSYVATLEPLQKGDVAMIRSGVIVSPKYGLGEVALDERGKPVLNVATDVVALRVGVRNGSRELIGPVNIRVLDMDRGERIEELSLLLPFVNPESVVKRTFYFAKPIDPGRGALGVSIAFKDSSSNWWSREQREPVQNARWDPANESDSEYLAEAARRGFHVMGFHRSPASALTGRVRAHLRPVRVRLRRRIRTWRGLHAVP